MWYGMIQEQIIVDKKKYFGKLFFSSVQTNDRG
jgi:hypothetical protein